VLIEFFNARRLRAQFAQAEYSGIFTAAVYLLKDVQKKERPPFLGRRPSKCWSNSSRFWGRRAKQTLVLRRTDSYFTKRVNGFTVPSFLPFLIVFAFAFAMVVFLLFSKIFVVALRLSTSAI
jgi:hypothetical protein